MQNEPYLFLYRAQLTNVNIIRMIHKELSGSMIIVGNVKIVVIVVNEYLKQIQQLKIELCF